MSSCSSAEKPAGSAISATVAFIVSSRGDAPAALTVVDAVDAADADEGEAEDAVAPTEVLVGVEGLVPSCVDGGTEVALAPAAIEGVVVVVG